MFRLALILYFFSFQAKAQVESGAYDLMLSTLLSHSVPEISVKELSEMKGVLLADAREAEEFAVSRMAGAKHVGYNKFDIESFNNVSKEQKIVVYCSVGYRSEKVAERLRQAGFKNVFNLYGGIFEWVNQGKIVVNSASQPTENVHAFSATWGIWLNKGTKVYTAPWKNCLSGLNYWLFVWCVWALLPRLFGL